MNPSPRLPIGLARMILWATGIHLLIGLALLLAWLATNDFEWQRWFFGYMSPIFFLSFGILEVSLCYLSWRQVSAGEPLRRAWLWIWTAAVCRLVGTVFSHILSTDSYINPRYAFSESWDAAAAAELTRLGGVIGGNVHMVALAYGLFLVLRVYKQLGLGARLKSPDIAVLGVVLLFTLSQLYEFGTWIARSVWPETFYKALSWTTDPMLSVLLVEAIFLRRAVVQMGWGLISKTWGAYAAAIFLTSIGNIGLWATAYEYISWPLSSMTWYIWYPATAAYTLGPAYQVEAAARVTMDARAVSGARWHTSLVKGR